MEVKVDQSRCRGHARCLAIAPGLFSFDDAADRAYVVVSPVPAEAAALAREAALECPEKAIDL